MRLKLPHSLRYPITVTELLKRDNDDIQQAEAIFLYYYKTKVPEIDRDGNETLVEKSFPTRYESSVEGTLTKWLIKAGTTITKPG